MKKLYFFAALLLAGAAPAAAQQFAYQATADADPAVTTVAAPAALRPAVKADSVYATPEERPQFVGGDKALRDYIIKNLTYPEQAMRRHVSGQVVVRFVLSAQGKVKQVSIVRGPGYGLDDEALRLVWHMPAWKPARGQGQPVQSVCTLPLTFQQ